MIRARARKATRMGARPIYERRWKRHTQWLRGRECVGLQLAGHVCRGRVMVCHIRVGTDGTQEDQPSDYWAYPGCEAAHFDEQHAHGERTFATRLGFREPRDLALNYARQSPDTEMRRVMSQRGIR